MNTTLETALISAFAASGVVGGFFAFLTAQRNNTTLEKNKKVEVEATIVGKQIDDGMDVRHVQQTLLDSLRVEFKDFKEGAARAASDLDKVKNEVLDYKERLGLANVELKDLRSLCERQQSQITTLQDSERARRQEYQETILQLQTENKDLRDANQFLVREMSLIRKQVEGNSKEIRQFGDIGALEHSTPERQDATQHGELEPAQEQVKTL